MAIRAKFVCCVVSRYPQGASVTMEPVVTGSPENELFYKNTPAGKIELSIIQPETAKLFVPGQSYYVTFEHADANVLADNALKACDRADVLKAQATEAQAVEAQAAEAQVAEEPR